MTCWICNRPAETGEHKIKKSLLVALHGRGPYKGTEAVSHITDGGIYELQGPNSQRIKYPDSLCSDCNNRRTQPFDLAFDRFSSFVIDREPDILRHRVIDFVDVYGAGAFEVGQRDLFKYFVKLLGCQLAHSAHAVPEDLKVLLDQDAFVTRLRITFAVNEDKLLFQSAQERPIGVGGLNTTSRNQSHKDDPKYRWHTFFSFLHVFYWYWIEPDGPFGAKWFADSRYLYLGSYYPLTSEQREDVKQKIRDAEP